MLQVRHGGSPALPRPVDLAHLRYNACVWRTWVGLRRGNWSNVYVGLNSVDRFGWTQAINWLHLHPW
jgi:hypothetical protein